MKSILHYFINVPSLRWKNLYLRVLIRYVDPCMTTACATLMYDYIDEVRTLTAWEVTTA